MTTSTSNKGFPSSGSALPSSPHLHPAPGLSARRGLPEELPGAILVGGIFFEHGATGESSLRELSRLARSAGFAIAGEVSQRLRRPHAAFFLGRGRAEMLAALVRARGAKIAIFDNELSSAQTRNLEGLLGVRVLDRTELILAIFAQHARSREARTQVELAQMEYELSHLRGRWSHLERQVGGVGVRGGPGERQLEVDRRILRDRIAGHRRELSRLTARRSRAVASRAGAFQVSLVGYTNAGKSTLMNALTGENFPVEDELFTTLDTRTRSLPLPVAGGGERQVLLSDTVGFVRQLPHHLVASFHATLEEVREADLLIHVADLAAANYRAQIRAVEEVLKELGCREKETLLVFNKIDLLRSPGELSAARSEYPGALALSARTREGLSGLCAEILRRSLQGFLEVELLLPQAFARELERVENSGSILARERRGEALFLRALLPAGEFQRLSALDGRPAGQSSSAGGGRVEVLLSRSYRGQDLSPAQC